MNKAIFVCIIILITSCSCSSEEAFEARVVPTSHLAPSPTSTTPSPTETSQPTPTPTPEPTSTLGTNMEFLAEAHRQICAEFNSSYLTDCLQPTSYQIYLEGVQTGNDPHAFIVIGDSNSVPAVFMGQYERCCTDDLQSIADWYAGSFALSHALRQNGLSVKDVSSELLIEALATNKPSIAFVALGSNWVGGTEEWANQYEQILLTLMNDYQVLPVLWTVSDTPHLNIEIRALAAKYQLPLVEWASIGKAYLSADGVHFIVAGWTVRSRVGLEVLSQLRNMIDSYDRIIH